MTHSIKKTFVCSKYYPYPVYYVTYNGNHHTGGNLPKDTNAYLPGATVTVLPNTSFPLERKGFQFAGWTLSGTTYTGGNTFVITTHLTLYAKWIRGGVLVVYRGTGTPPPSSKTYYPALSTQTVVPNTYTNESLVFGGWNTMADGTGTCYIPGASYTVPGAGTVTLYAQWIQPTTTYTVTYSANGGTGTSTVTYSSFFSVTIAANTFTYGSLVFYEWNTVSDGSGQRYFPGSFLTLTQNTTLYAQWRSSTPQYVVTYHANGATGSVPSSTSYPANVKVPIAGQGNLTYDGYTFLGWNASRSVFP